MAVLDVGNENLPNVYITKITLSRSEVKITCLMKDDKEIKTWRDRHQMSNLKVKVLLVHDRPEVTGTGPSGFLSITSGLNSGQSSLFDYDLSGDSVVIMTSAVSEFGLREIEDSLTDDDYYYNTFSFVDYSGNSFIQNVNNMTVYVACFLDGLQFENALFNKYYGPAASENIIIGNQVNNQSGYFYIPSTDIEYGGPVHSHDGVYMEGSSHQAAEHERLVYVPEQNNKITLDF